MLLKYDDNKYHKNRYDKVLMQFKRCIGFDDNTIDSSVRDDILKSLNAIVGSNEPYIFMIEDDHKMHKSVIISKYVQGWRWNGHNRRHRNRVIYGLDPNTGKYRKVDDGVMTGIAIKLTKKPIEAVVVRIDYDLFDDRNELSVEKNESTRLEDLIDEPIVGLHGESLYEIGTYTKRINPPRRSH